MGGIVNSVQLPFLPESEFVAQDNTDVLRNCEHISNRTETNLLQLNGEPNGIVKLGAFHFQSREGSVSLCY